MKVARILPTGSDKRPVPEVRFPCIALRAPDGARETWARLQAHGLSRYRDWPGRARRQSAGSTDRLTCAERACSGCAIAVWSRARRGSKAPSPERRGHFARASPASPAPRLPRTGMARCFASIARGRRAPSVPGRTTSRTQPPPATKRGGKSGCRPIQAGPPPERQALQVRHYPRNSALRSSAGASTACAPPESEAPPIQLRRLQRPARALRAKGPASFAPGKRRHWES